MIINWEQSKSYQSDQVNELTINQIKDIRVRLKSRLINH